MSQWIIFDRKTGAWNGIYRDKEMAQDSLDSLTTNVPQADWVLEKFTASKAPPEFDFWTNHYEKEYFKGLKGISHE